MSKKALYKISGFLLLVAPIMTLGIKSLLFVGEPKLPDKLEKQ